MLLALGYLSGLAVAPQASALDPLRSLHEPSPGWTLEQALEYAFAHSPDLRAGAARVQEAEAVRLTAATIAFNPELEVEAGDRRGPAGSSVDRRVSISQEVEISGQRRARSASARRESEAAQQVFSREKDLLTFRVAAAFGEALRARELLTVAEIDARLAGEALEFSRRRLDRGATTQIEVNVAQVSAGRAERSLRQAEAASVAARSRLAALAGRSPAALPAPKGELILGNMDLPPLPDLVRYALAKRGDLAAARLRESAAGGTVKLARLAKRPRLKVGGFVEKEDAAVTIAGGTIGLSLPVFNRGRGQVIGSLAREESLGHELAALRLAVEQEVMVAFSSLRAAYAAGEALRTQVLETLQDSVELLQKSFAAGRISATEVVVLRRELIAGRREYVEALSDAWLARAELNLATGGYFGPPSLISEEAEKELS